MRCGAVESRAVYSLRLSGLVDSMATGGDFPNRPCRHSIGVPPGKAVIPSTQAIGTLT